MRVIGINASPRKGANTATLVETVLKGAEGRGAETKLVDLRKLKVAVHSISLVRCAISITPPGMHWVGEEATASTTAPISALLRNANTLARWTHQGHQGLHQRGPVFQFFHLRSCGKTTLK